MQMYLNKLFNKFLYIYEKYRSNVFFKFILDIASFFYMLAYKTRLILYKLKLLRSNSLNATVISIGNITTGGTGKTPLVIETAKHFLNQGRKVGILSRGYKRRIINNNNDALLVSDGQEILIEHELSGDEPYLIAKKIPKAIVVVGKDRIKTGKAAIKLGAEILILDDGYQNMKLNKNENILLLDGHNPFDNGHLLPSGKLRESLDSIKRASTIIISNPDKKGLTQEIIKTIKDYAQDKPIFYLNYRIKQLKGINITKTINIENLKDTKAIGFCGIANPKSFLKSLEENYINLSSFLTYPDHYNYSVEDITHIIKLAQNNKIENIITTEKDAIKIEGFCESAPVTFWTTILEVTWENPDALEMIFAKKTKTSR